MLRIAAALSQCSVVLSDGVDVARGDTIADLHVWNERVPRFPPGGANLAWGHQVSRRITATLSMLADELTRDRWSSTKVVRAAINVPGRRRLWLWSR